MRQEKLGTYTVNRSQVPFTMNELKRTYTRAQEAFTHLCAIQDYPTPHDLSELTTKAVTDYITPKVKAVDNADYLTADKKEEIKAMWETIRKEVCSDLKVINDFRQRYEDVTLTIAPDGSLTMTKDTPDFQTIAEGMNSTEIVKEAHEHWQLITMVLNAVGVLRTWEREHDVVKIKLEQLAALDAQQFAEIWTFGNMTIDHSFDHLPTAQRETTLQNLYL